MQGKIIKGIAGFYYVNIEGEGIFECKAKGAFRNSGQKPLVGDDVTVECLDAKKHYGNLVEIEPRKNELIRPACANVDQAFIVLAAKSPEPNLNLLDRMLIYMDQNDVPCSVCFNKEDLVFSKNEDEIRNIYKESGHEVLFISVHEKYGIGAVRERMNGKTTVLAGPSGVGKSSLVNMLCNKECMETGDISRKNERGKNTTRHAELLPVGENTYIMDTPGFTSMGMFDISKEDLHFYYNEFNPYEDKCRFRGCVHINEPNCAVKNAFNEGLISKTRYENYVLIYEELKNMRNKKDDLR